MDSGVATRPIADLDAYRERSTRFVYHSGTTMEPVFAAAQAARPSASSTPKARTSACCARRRSRSTRASRGRCWSAAPTSSRRTHREARPAARRSAATATASTSSTTRATATSGREYYQLGAAQGRVARAGAGGHAQPADADRRDAGAARRRRRDAVRHGRATIADHLRYVRKVDRPARGRAHARGDADADPARAASSSSATRTSTAIRPRSRSPR